jgi:hypothetical protein
MKGTLLPWRLGANITINSDVLTLLQGKYGYLTGISGWVIPAIY